MKDKLLNGSAGYGELSNLIRLEKVLMVTHHEGIGTEESPVRQIMTFFTLEGEMLSRIDPLRKLT